MGARIDTEPLGDSRRALAPRGHTQGPFPCSSAKDDIRARIV